MLLKRIELNGFKSFANRTTIPFGSGLTAIVGPNGSGKSNFVDAVRWVLGEQKIKSLRAGESIDVIFTGNEYRKAMSLAAVTLVLDNTNNRFEADGDELSLCRRLYRDGTSEYLLNGKKVRLKDIRDVLFGTGLGVNEYSIIEQGKVDLLLQLSPIERRALFDEAAGILRYKERRNESLKNLDKVEENLARLNDIIEEVAAQQRSLSNQAARARRFLAMRETLDKARLDLFVLKYRDLSDEKITIAQRLAECETSYASGLAEFGRISADKERAVSAQSSLRDSRAALSDEIVRFEGQCSRLDNELSWLNKKIAENERRLESLKVDETAAQRRQADIAQELKRLDEELSLLTAERNGKEQATANLADSLRALEPKFYENRTELRLLETRREQAREEKMKLEGAKAKLAAEFSKVEEQKRWYATELERADKKLSSIDAAVEEIDISMRTSNEELKSLTTREAECAARLDYLDSNINALNTETQRLGAECAVLEKQLKQLRSIEVAFANESKRGDISRMADSITVAAGWELAAESLLGEFLGATLLNTGFPEGDGAWAYPSADKVVRLTPQSKFGSPASEFVKCIGPFNGAFTELSANVFFVENLVEASLIPSGVTLIDKSGAVCTRYRFLRSGASKSPQERTLYRRSEIVRIEQEFLKAKSFYDEKLAALESIRNERNACIRESADISRDKRRAEVNVHIRNDKRSNLRHEQGALRGVKSELADKIAAAEKMAEKLSRDLDSASAPVAESNQDNTIDERIEALRREMGGISRERERLQAAVTEARIAMATTIERINASVNSTARLKRESGDMATRIESSNAERIRIAKEIEGTKQAEEKARVAMAQASAEVQARRVSLAKLDDELAALEIEHRRITESLHSLEKMLDTERDKRETLRIALNEIDVRIASLVERCVETMGIPLPEESDVREIGDTTMEQLEDEIEDCEKKLKSVGSVNLEAVNLLEGIEKRLAFLSEQRNDLIRSRTSLLEIIDDANARCRAMFMETFERTKQNFNDIFRKLFGGGRAELSLQEGDMLEAGVEITVRPPDKEPRQLSLLSGGEKALTAISLLMAMFRANPSPFCVLDEVDAPLDESNIQRFMMLLREFSDRSQFIVITHNKATIELTDDIFGITLDRECISRTVSVRLEKVDALLGGVN